MLQTLKIACMGLFLGAGPAGAAEKSDIVIMGTVSFADFHHYLELPFEVPQGTNRLSVDFSHDGMEHRTTIDLGLADPDRQRGWSGGNKTHFTLAETDATPSFLPGPIPVGRWQLLLGIPNIRPGVLTHYRAEIWFGRRGDVPAVSHFSDAPLKSGPAWFRGDLHLHTAHSDGYCISRSGAKVNCPVFRTIEAAEARGLDFIAISDHNTVSQFQDLRELQPYFDKTLLIPARELTTFEGHANAWGTMDPIDFRVDGVHVADAGIMATAVHRSGGIFSINHPRAPSGERCMGCGAELKNFDYAKADAVEVVNGGSIRGMRSFAQVDADLRFWRDLLTRGFSPTAVGGSDNHDADLPFDAAGSVGSPTTVVYAASLSERDILAALKSGHVFIDVAGCRDRFIEIAAKTPAGRYGMGDHASLARGTVATILLHVEGVLAGRIAIIADGANLVDGVLDSPLGHDDSRFLRYAGDGGRHWLYAEVRDSNDRLALVSNPIYFGPPAMR